LSSYRKSPSPIGGFQTSPVSKSLNKNKLKTVTQNKKNQDYTKNCKIVSKTVRISTHIYKSCAVVNILSNNTNYLRQIIKKAQISPMREKSWNSTFVPPNFRDFSFVNARFGTGTSYACAILILKIQTFIINLSNLAAQNSAKQLVSKYHQPKSLSNNTISVVKPR